MPFEIVACTFSDNLSRNSCIQFIHWHPVKLTFYSGEHEIGHFQVPPDLCFKTRVGAQPLKWKSFFILMQIKLIFTRKVVHLASF